MSASPPNPAHEGPDAILAQQVAQGAAELERPSTGLVLSALSAGLDVGFSAFFMGVVLTFVSPETGPLALRGLLGLAYSVGFVLVIVGRSELFTEHTALAVFPVLDGRGTGGQLARVWGLVYGGNLIGATVFAWFAATLGGRLGVIDHDAFHHVAGALLDHDTTTILMSAIAAGWLMGLVSWLVAASSDTMAMIVVVVLVTGGMGVAGLHHCIVGSVEVLSAVFAGTGVGFADYARFLALSTFGNIVGGVALVAILKYGHAARTA